VPDFTANAGTNAWFWWTILRLLEPAAGPAFARLGETMRTAVRSLLVTAAREGIPPRQAAERFATSGMTECYGTSKILPKCLLAFM